MYLFTKEVEILPHSCLSRRGLWLLPFEGTIQSAWLQTGPLKSAQGAISLSVKNIILKVIRHAYTRKKEAMKFLHGGNLKYMASSICVFSQVVQS